MDVFKFHDYRELIGEVLKNGKKSRPRGIIQKAAEYLKCHPTFISQVLHEKSDLSIDQGVLFCEFAQFNEEETEYFLDLLFLERSASAPGRRLFKKRLQKHLSKRASFGERVKAEGKINQELRRLYYQSWIPQTLHVYLQIGDGATCEKASQVLGIAEEEVAEHLANLEEMDLIQRNGKKYQSKVSLVHTANDDPIINQIHTNWRLHTIQQLQSRQKIRDVHFSSVMSLSKESVQMIKNYIFDHIENVSEEVKQSRSETVYAYCLDFYPVLSS